MSLVLPKITRPYLVMLEFLQEPVHENNLLATNEKVLTAGGALLTHLHWSLMGNTYYWFFCLNCILFYYYYFFTF